MGERENREISYKWITIKDEATRIQGDFPSKPLKMVFELPFQNTPPEDLVSVYSLPMASGLLVLSTYTSAMDKPKKMSREALFEFFRKVLVPHFFYNPPVFNDHLDFEYLPKIMDGRNAADFKISYLDQNVKKNIEGSSFVNGESLYVYFCLGSAREFDENISSHFLKTVKLF